MATATAKKQKTVKEKLSDAKARMKQEMSAAKSKYKAYKEKIKHANRVGYNSGKNDYKQLPKVVGAKAAATAGYNTALHDTAKIEKLQKKGAKANGNGKK